MNTSKAITLEQKAGLEFAYIEALAPYLRTREGYGIPRKYVEHHPDLFIQAIVWTYKRSDGDEDRRSGRLHLTMVETSLRVGTSF